MAKYKLTARLDEKSLTKLENDLRNYRENILSHKVETLVKELADLGILTAKTNVSKSGRYGTHKMEEHIVFYKQISKGSNSQYVGYVIGQGEPFLVTWYPSGESVPQTDTIFPLHMVEFGTAGYAITDYYDSYGGKGSMSTQGNTDKTDWYFFDAYGNKKVGTAIKPTQPMYKASVQIITNVKSIIKKVFG